MRDQESDRVHLTQSGVTMGTPLYMSPEQAQGHAIDHRGDLYSLGVTYYHMLTGVPPFHAETALALALKQVREAPRSMLIHRPDLPPELDRLVLKLMEKDPADRYQSAAEMLADLAKIRDSLAIGAATAVIPDGYMGGSSARGDDSPSTLATAENARTGASRAPRRPTQQSPPRWSSRCGAACRAEPRGGDRHDVSLRCSLARFPDTSPATRTFRRFRRTLPRPIPHSGSSHAGTAVPNQGTAEKQFRYALLQAPHDEWAAAFFAVIGYFPHSHELRSKAYGQLARIFYRQRDVRALETLETELSQWKEAKKRDQDLVDAVRQSPSS